MRLEFLTPAQLIRITKRRKPKAQLKVLRARKYAVDIDGDGRPLVLRAHVEAKFGIAASGEPRRKATKPDWSYLDAKKKTR